MDENIITKSTSELIAMRMKGESIEPFVKAGGGALVPHWYSPKRNAGIYWNPDNDIVSPATGIVGDINVGASNNINAQESYDERLEPENLSKLLDEFRSHKGPYWTNEVKKLEESGRGPFFSKQWGDLTKKMWWDTYEKYLDDPRVREVITQILDEKRKQDMSKTKLKKEEKRGRKPKIELTDNDVHNKRWDMDPRVVDKINESDYEDAKKKADKQLAKKSGSKDDTSST